MEKTENFTISDMHCASCVNTIQKDLKKLDGIHKAFVNFATEKAEITYDCHKLKPEDIVAHIKKSGYTAIPASAQTNHHMENMDDMEGMEHHDHAAMESRKETQSKLYKIIFGALASIVIVAIDFFLDFRNEGVVSLLLALAILLYTGREFFMRGIPALILRARPGMDTLVALGVGAAFLYSSYNVLFTENRETYFMDAAIIATFIMFGRYLEAKAKGSANEAIKKLMQLSAKVAHKVISDNKTEDIPIDQVKVGDILMVKPGEKIPVDGEIVRGNATIDESMVTGESMPVDKEAKDKVIGATINGNAVFTMKAEKIGSETMLAQMIKLVEEAQMHKAPIQKLVDLISNYFVWGVMIIATATFLIWYFTGTEIDKAIIYTVAVLIIACPCALGLATPISIVVGSGKGASLGILMKKPESLEKMHKITAICFDKTGTITEGKPKVTDFITAVPALGVGDEKHLRYIASLEAQSEHPLAKAVTDFADDSKLEYLEAKEVKAVTGKGISGKVNDRKVLVGSRKFLQSENIKLNEEYSKKADELAEDGKTILFFALDGEHIGILALRDEEKESSKDAVKLLHQRGIKTVMMTGDNEAVAKSIAKRVGIDEVFAEITPEGKTEKIKELKAKGEFVAMVGDGINDAPALATADVGIAMGTGTDVAIESGDIVLVKGDLMKAVEAIELSKATFRNIKQNLFWAFIYNSVGIPVAALGLLNPIFSAGAMAFSSVSVVLNALRLKRFKTKL